ncbi:MAG: hypothetical protein M5R36_16705 [Deltaproteobacteria bacterium]|nr:hypothetical protein [Deltaproteobacteria bacterium]
MTRRFGWYFIFAVLAAVFGIVGVSACDGGGSDDDVDELPADDDVDDDDDGLPENPTWENFAENFFQTYCVRCHQDPPINDAEFPLETYEDVLPQLTDIKLQAVVSDEMPADDEGPLPSDAEREKLGEWIDAGAPEN